jgi:hypothetical protein
MTFLLCALFVSLMRMRFRGGQAAASWSRLAGAGRIAGVDLVEVPARIAVATGATTRGDHPGARSPSSAIAAQAGACSGELACPRSPHRAPLDARASAA